MVVAPVSVFFVFVSPDGSASRHRSDVQGRGAFIYPCRAGCVERRLPEVDRKREAHRRN